jgi:hypothetical protein
MLEQYRDFCGQEEEEHNVASRFASIESERRRGREKKATYITVVLVASSPTLYFLSSPRRLIKW